MTERISFSADPGGTAGFSGGNGRDIILGDNGDMERRNSAADVGTIVRSIIDNSGVIVSGATLTPVWFTSRSDDLQGGNETLIEGGYHGDFILGGIGSDTTITGGQGDDVIFGDNGAVGRADGSSAANDFWSIDPSHGGKRSFTAAPETTSSSADRKTTTP